MRTGVAITVNVAEAVLPLVTPVAVTVFAPSVGDDGTRKVVLHEPEGLAEQAPTGEPAKNMETVSPDVKPLTDAVAEEPA